MKVISFDISTKTGFCWTADDIPKGYRTEWFVKEKGQTNERYMVGLYERVLSVCDPTSTYPPFVILEDYAFGAQGRAKTLLAELGGVAKLALCQEKVPFVVVTPTQWKAYVLGASHAKKEDIKTLVLKKFKQDFSSKSNDECDAYCMWLLGRELANPNAMRKTATAKFYELRERVQGMLYEGHS